MEIAKDVLFNVLAVMFFTAVLYSVWSQAPGTATVAVFAAVFCTLVGNPDRFETMKFSLTGVETKAREVIRQAEVTQREFQKLAAMTGELLIDLNAAQGRFGGSGDGKTRDQRKALILEALRSIGLSKGDLTKIGESDREWNIIDYVNGILNSAGKKIPADRIAGWQSALSPINTSIEGLKTTRPEKIHALLDQHGVLDEDKAELIGDFEHYVKTGEQRRPEVWAQRYAW